MDRCAKNHYGGKMSRFKKLTPDNFHKVNSLIKRRCCNYDNGNCILLDDGYPCVCPQAISYSLHCKWFRNYVLPNNQKLYSKLYITENRKRCAICGDYFIHTSNRAKYCEICRKRVTRLQATWRKRKQREVSRFRKD